MENYKIMNTLKTIILAMLFIPLWGAAQPWQEDLHYEVLTPKFTHPLQSKTNEVIEFFYYGCPHCYRLEPHVRLWLKRKPANVSFHLIPATFTGGRWDWSARLFYTAQALNVESKVHDLIFEAQHAPGGKKIRSNSDMANIFSKVGVDRKTFENTYNSFTVRNQVEQARNLSNKSGIQGVPAIIINGKYLTSVSQAGSENKLFRLVDWLIKNKP